MGSVITESQFINYFVLIHQSNLRGCCCWIEEKLNFNLTCWNHCGYCQAFTFSSFLWFYNLLEIFSPLHSKCLPWCWKRRRKRQCESVDKVENRNTTHTEICTSSLNKIYVIYYFENACHVVDSNLMKRAEEIYVNSTWFIVLRAIAKFMFKLPNLRK